MKPPVRRRRGYPLTEGTKLADRVQALGLMLKDVAEGTGIDRWQLNDYLCRRVRITPRNLQRLAEFLQCEPESLIER
jgi:transcriptional regulator with XRE-family HTH domain